MFSVNGTQAKTMSEAYTGWLLKHWFLVFLLTIMVISGCLLGLRYFVLNNNYEVFFDEDDPRVVAYQEARREYSRDDTVFFVVTAKEGEVFDRRVLEAVSYLTDQAWLLPYAVRVDSITTFQHVKADEEGFIVEALVSDPEFMSDAEIAAARETAYAEPVLQNRLLREGSPVTGVNVTVNMPEDVPQVSLTVTRAAEDLRMDVLTRYPEVSLRMTGLVPMNSAFLVTSLADITRLVPLMVVIIVISMALLLKSFFLMLAVIFIVLMASLMTVGLISWGGYEISGVTTPLPLIILTLGVADCVHILVSVQNGIRLGMNKAEAIIESMRVNMQPVFITSLTTAIGFLCMNVAPAPTLRALGNFSALGVMIAYLLAVVLLPPLTYVLPFRVKTRSDDRNVLLIMEKLGAFVIRNKFVLLIVMVVITLFFVVQLPSLEVNNQLVHWFAKDYPFRQDSEYAMEHLTGIYQIVFNVPADGSDSITDPDYLAHVDKFTTWLSAQPGVVQTGSIACTLKRLNRAMHGDDPEQYILPRSRELAAQYLLLYEMSLPVGMDLNTDITMDKSASRIVAMTRSMHSNEMAALVQTIDAWQRDNLPAKMITPALGSAVMMGEMAQRMMRSMMVSAPLAIILVSMALAVALRSVKYGLISLVPNLMPLIVGFGVWAFCGWTLNYNMTTIVAMSVGIVVDDTVHFMSKYLRARRELHLSPESGIRYAFASVGQAMWVTSFILVAGFSVMTLSPKAYGRDMGTLTGIIVIVALLADFLLLPALLLYTDSAKKSGRQLLGE